MGIYKHKDGLRKESENDEKNCLRDQYGFVALCACGLRADQLLPGKGAHGAAAAGAEATVAI